jgi:long-chain acyl-CoA synthetase
VNLASIIDGHPAAAPAVIGSDRVLTYAELAAEAAALRGGLAARGVSPGDRVVLALANDWPFAVAYLAVLGLGAVAVPIDPTLPPPALAGEVAQVSASVAVAGPAAAAAVDTIGVLTTVVAAPGAEHIRGAAPWREVASAEPAPVVDRQAGDLAVLVFTSGTAGHAKAAMLTHGSLLANLDQVQRHPGRAVLPADVAYGVLPLFHVFGLNVSLGLSLCAGASILLVDRFDAGTALEQIPARGVTLLAGPPTLFAELARAPGTGRELAGVRLAVSGAAPLAPEVAAAFEERFGLPLWQGYGLTEASPVVTSSVIGGQRKPGSVGVPLPGVEMRLVDDGGEDAFVGDPGEIWVRGDNVFAGFWEDPEATAAVLSPGGWLRTGDIGVVDDDEYLYLVDRAKDLIIVSGFNVFPAEVEAVLAAHPDVSEAAVLGVPDAHSGEAVRAYVVGTASEAELSAWCRQRLAHYKVPSQYLFVESLPRGLSGKTLRRALIT